MKKSSVHKKRLIFYLIPFLVLALFAQIAMKPSVTTDKRSKAQAVDSIYFVPSASTITTTPTTLQVHLNVGTKFADIIGGRITFDTTKVHVAPSGVTIHSTGLGANSGQLTVQISPASVDTINTTGIIDFTLMVAPASSDVRPTGDMILADIPLISVNTGVTSVATQLDFHPVITEVYVGVTLTDPSAPITLAKNSATLMVDPVSGSMSPTPSTTPPEPSITTVPINTPTRTPTPTPIQNPVQSPTPTPTQAPVTDITFDLHVRLNGVNGNAAEGARATVRFVKGNLDLVTPSIPMTYIGSGVYAIRFVTSMDVLIPGDGYTMIVKAEKHLSRKYCKQTGQTSVCQSFESMNILAPVSAQPVVYDFTGLGLAPGDLMIQDGKADSADFDKIKSRMAIACDQLTDVDKQTADVDYNGCVNSLDAFWMRNTLETRYDEN